MWKALLKKQFLETASSLFNRRGASAKSRSPWFTVLIVCLLVYAFGALIWLTWIMSEALCLPFVQNGLTWCYFALFGMAAFSVATFMLALAAKPRLYEAKDNEALLAMPIPPYALLLTRMLGLYILALGITLLLFAPAVAYYFVAVGFSWTVLFGSVLVLCLLPLAALAVAALIGGVIALLTANMPAKNWVSSLLLVALMIGYSLLMGESESWLSYLVLHGTALAENVKNGLYPFWQMGLAASGDGVAALLFAGMAIGTFGVVYALLSRTFLYAVTNKRSSKKKKYVEKEGKTRSALLALTWKEGKRLFSNPMLLFNCGLGSVLSVVFAGFAVFNGGLRSEIVNAPVDKGMVATIVAIIFSFIAASNVLSASSVSLEGDNLWALRSMPVATETILQAKLLFHTLFTVIPLTLSEGVVCALLQIPFGTSVLAVASGWATTAVCAAAGLAVNLKLPNLKWTNELVAVKQSLSPMLSMFIGWAVAALFLGGDFLLGQYMRAEWYFVVAIAAFAVAAALLCVWLKKRGTAIFEEL